MSRVFQSQDLSDGEKIAQLTDMVEGLSLRLAAIKRRAVAANDKRRAYKLQLKHVNRAHRLLILEHRELQRKVEDLQERNDTQAAMIQGYRDDLTDANNRMIAKSLRPTLPVLAMIHP